MCIKKKCAPRLLAWSARHNPESLGTSKTPAPILKEVVIEQVVELVLCCVLEKEATIMPPSEAPYPSGKGAVCKTAMQRFEPARRLQLTFS
jgi:hypothetical protein